MNDQDIYKDLVEAMQNLEQKIGLKEGFFEQLRKEDDWSFIIKTHTLIDASLTLLISKAVGIQQLDEFFAAIQLNDKKRGKVAVAKALGIFVENELQIIGAVSEIRNKLVHDIFHVQLDLNAYVGSLNEKKRQEFINTFGVTFLDEIVLSNGDIVQKHDYILRHPKIAIWRACLLILGYFSMQVDNLELKQQARELEREMHETYARLYQRTPPPSEN